MWKSFKERGPLSKCKIVALIGITLFFGMIVLGAMVKEDNKPPETDSQNIKVATSKSRGNPSSDKELFMKFYGEIMSKTSTLDKIYEPFQKAILDKQLDRAKLIAKDVNEKMTSEWYNLNGVHVPDMQNDAIEQELRNVKNNVAMAYSLRANMPNTFLEIIKNPDNMDSSFKSLQAQVDEWNVRLISGIATLTNAGIELGISVESLKQIR